MVNATTQVDDHHLFTEEMEHDIKLFETRKASQTIKEFNPLHIIPLQHMLDGVTVRKATEYLTAIQLPKRLHILTESILLQETDKFRLPEEEKGKQQHHYHFRQRHHIKLNSINPDARQIIDTTRRDRYLAYHKMQRHIEPTRTEKELPENLH
jgi:hypothetical protein